MTATASAPLAIPAVSPRPNHPFELLNQPRVNLLVSIVGRLGLVYLFCFAAVFHLSFGWKTTITEMVARGVPFPGPLMVLAMIWCVGCTLALLVGYKPRWAALGLALYVLTVSSIIYTPGSFVAGPDTRIFFMKDMAIFGALLMLSCALSANQRLAAQLRQAQRGS